MRNLSLIGLIAMAISQVGWVAPASAANAQMFANAKAVLVMGDSRFGGCMVSLTTDPQSVLPSCAVGWVSLSCTGDFNDPVRAYRMLDQAQLAIATNMRMRIEISDTNKHNGYCVAYRVDVVR